MTSVKHKVGPSAPVPIPGKSRRELEKEIQELRQAVDRRIRNLGAKPKPVGFWAWLYKIS